MAPKTKFLPRGCHAGMGIASLLLPETSVFCYVVSREAAGEAPVTLEDAHAITSAPLVRKSKACMGPARAHASQRILHPRVGVLSMRRFARR